MTKARKSPTLPPQTEQPNIAPPPVNRESLCHRLRKENAGFKLRKVDPAVHREPPHGWLLTHLLDADDAIWGRWDYWTRTALSGQLLFNNDGSPEPIPQIDWKHNAQTRKMLEQCLDSIPRSGGWQSWGGSVYFDYFLDWLLYGLGDIGQTESPKEPSDCQGASDRLYQVYQQQYMQLWPNDYFGDMMAEARFGRHQGFFPTPLHVCQMMTQMQFCRDGDHRAESVMDPCLGTGRFLLTASNYSLCLYGQDVNATCVKASKVNAALYAPWLYRPLPFLGRTQGENTDENQGEKRDENVAELSHAPMETGEKQAGIGESETVKNVAEVAAKVTATGAQMALDLLFET